MSIDPRTSWLGYYSRFNGSLISQICYSILYWAFVSNLNKKQSLHTTYYILLSTAIASALAIGEHFGIFTTCGLMNLGWKESCWVQDVQNRVFSTLGQPNWLAALLVALIPLTWTKSYKYYLLLILFFVTLLFTKSRSGLLAFGIEAIIFWSFVFWQSKLKFVKEFVFIFLSFSFLAFVFWYKPITGNLSPIISQEPALESGGTESGTIRKYVWFGAIEVFKHYPILGTGPETFAFSFPMFKPVGHNLTSEWDFVYNKAHNEFLNYLANTGILGFLSYIALVVCSIIIIFKSKRFDLLSGYIAILITNFFGFSVVPVSLLFFLIPAITIVHRAEYIILSKNTKTSIGQKIAIYFVLIINFYLLFVIYQYWRADIYFNSSQFEKALDISPNEPNYISKYALSKASVELSLNALNLSPYNQNVRKILISNLVKNSDKETNNLLPKADQILLAEGVIKDGIVLSPNDPRLYYQLGILQLKIAKSDEAVKNLEKTVELKPNYKEGRFALGSIYKALNQNSKAIEQFEYILKFIDPNDELTKKYLEESNQPQK
ncbi:MAG: hypothetical protein ACD_19C00426G0071 [uncultured bacterium]|nr:MAG: hypothetical protein ACD_19C00426G0071 [uncultured bacterium]